MLTLILFVFLGKPIPDASRPYPQSFIHQRIFLLEESKKNISKALYVKKIKLAIVLRLTRNNESIIGFHTYLDPMSGGGSPILIKTTYFGEKAKKVDSFVELSEVIKNNQWIMPGIIELYHVPIHQDNILTLENSDIFLEYETRKAEEPPPAEPPKEEIIDAQPLGAIQPLLPLKPEIPIK